MSKALKITVSAFSFSFSIQITIIILNSTQFFIELWPKIKLLFFPPRSYLVFISWYEKQKKLLQCFYVLRQFYLYDKTHGEFHHNDSKNIWSISPISAKQTMLSINISLGYYENSHSIYMSRMIMGYTYGYNIII